MPGGESRPPRRFQQAPVEPIRQRSPQGEPAQSARSPGLPGTPDFLSLGPGGDAAGNLAKDLASRVVGTVAKVANAMPGARDDQQPPASAPQPASLNGRPVGEAIESLLYRAEAAVEELGQQQGSSAGSVGRPRPPAGPPRGLRVGIPPRSRRGSGVPRGCKRPRAEKRKQTETGRGSRPTQSSASGRSRPTSVA
eukprot:jgi/Botrbrau1/10433/Bobra.0133s0040.1